MTFLLVLAVLTAWGLFVLVSPRASCPRTVTTKGRNGRSRTRLCPKCGGTGQRNRFGARAVHALFWSMFGTKFRDRLRNRGREDPQP